MGCLSLSLGNLCIPAAPMCWQTGGVLHNARVCLGKGDKDKAPPEQGRHWGGTQLLSAGDGERGSWPLHTVRSVWGRASILILSRWSPTPRAAPVALLSEGPGGGGWVSGLTAGGDSDAPISGCPRGQGCHLLQSSVSVSGSPVAGWELGWTACTLSSRLPPGNTT